MAVTPNVAPFINVTFYVTGEYGVVRPTHTHVGVDIATSQTADLYSIFDGTVVEKGSSSARGYYIVVKGTNNLAFLYQHMASASPLNIGDSVLLGQYVGTEGSTGQSTGLHLHMEMQDLTNRSWYFGNDINYYMNPCTYMGIPNVTGTECYYNGTPIPPTPPTPSKKDRNGFNWAVFTNIIRKKRT